jgi:hypothetical protein
VTRVQARRRARASLLRGAGPPGPTQSQAYCGPAHGRRWQVEPAHGPSHLVHLRTPGGVSTYRLLVYPGTRGPARDHQGRHPYLYVGRER